jgi:hypothetical protein
VRRNAQSANTRHMATAVIALSSVTTALATM